MGGVPPLLCSPPLPHQNLALIVVGLGAVFSLIFHLGTKEKPYPLGVLPEPEESTPLLHKEPPGPPRPLLLWKDWLLEPSFYQVRLGRTALAWACCWSPPSTSTTGQDSPALGCCQGACPGAGGDGEGSCSGHPSIPFLLDTCAMTVGRAGPSHRLSCDAVALSPPRLQCSTWPPASLSTCPRPTSPCTSPTRCCSPRWVQGRSGATWEGVLTWPGAHLPILVPCRSTLPPFP